MSTLTRDELLVLLIEECSEVIQAATKCLRFGYDRVQEGYGRNDLILAEEVGDLTGVLDALPLDEKIISRNRIQKITKAERYKQLYGVIKS